MKPLDFFFDTYDRIGQLFSRKPGSQSAHSSWWSRMIPALILLLIVFQFVLMFLWDSEPDAFEPQAQAASLASQRGETRATGYTTIATLIKVSETLLDKRGGYLSNDVMPPGLLMDNIPNWEFGALSQIRDMTLSLRNDLTRSQSQSTEDKDIVQAENQFRIDSESWMLPPSESEYRKAIDALYSYLSRLSDDNAQDAQFYARADNLSEWLGLVAKRLGSLSQRLSASVGQARLNTDLAGDAQAQQSTQAAQEVGVKTPWLEIDDVFYEARGSAWALMHLLKAVDHDFREILQNKNARVSVQQVIRELQATQETIWSPLVLNGGGFGMFANHSLVMANYLSRANTAVIDLQQLLKQG
ncbi:MAG TPA: DUF2333 family protein [Gammaproteobacteria bacterium]